MNRQIEKSGAVACLTCRHFGEVYGQEYGACRRGAPQIASGATDGIEHVRGWPRVYVDDQCGAYVRAFAELPEIPPAPDPNELAPMPDPEEVAGLRPIDPALFPASAHFGTGTSASATAPAPTASA